MKNLPGKKKRKNQTKNQTKNQRKNQRKSQRKNQKEKDYDKQAKIIKDLEEAKKNAEDKEQLEIINKYKEDLNKVIKLFDMKKKKQILKAKLINEKNETNLNYNINNNIIYVNKNSDEKQNNSQYALCELNEFKRPDSYIKYENTLEKRKIYEATFEDKIFLAINQNFMSFDELENVIIDFENNCINEKNNKINEESARKIIEEKYPKYLDYADKIINHFKLRRTNEKKSLIREYWRKGKPTDKYILNTFLPRSSNKRQSRKSNKNKCEKEEKKSCEDIDDIVIYISNDEFSNDNNIDLEEDNYDNNYIIRMDIRINRLNQIAIGRNLNKKERESFNDDNTEVISKYRKKDTNVMEDLKNKNFEKLNDLLNTNNLDNLNIFCNSDDEDTSSEMKEFSDNFKQFLKAKRKLKK